MHRRDLPRLLLTSSAAAAFLAPGAKASPERTGARIPRTQAEKDAGIMPEDETHPVGDVRRYGAAADGTADDTTALQAALDTGQSVFLPKGTYRVTRTLRFRASGQIFSGEGTGSIDSPALARIVYTGEPKGKVLSVSTGSAHLQQCTIRNLVVDGNNRANMGIELYDSAVPGGAWRNRVYDTAVLNCTQGENPTGIYMGARDFPNFAHDSILFGCYLHNCARGVWGHGAKYQIYSSTIFASSEAGICAGPGSAWTVQGSIFTANGRDFDGTNIQQADFSGCWFENSAHGIYRASKAHSVSFTGCFLHTNSRESMMDFGSAAGYHFIGGHFVPTNTRSSRVVNVNPDATGAVLGQSLSLSYAGSGREVPLMLLPNQAGTGAVRSASAQLRKGQKLTLPLGRGVFFIGVNVWNVASSGQREQGSYTAFLFDGDNEAVVENASRKGSGGGQSFTLTPSRNSVTLTYTGTDTVNAYMSGTGTIG